MIRKLSFKFKTILSLLCLFLLETVKNNQENDFNKYFFTMYPSKNSQNPYILHVNTPNSENLLINLSESDNNMIKKETAKDYVLANISSVYFHENEYLVKTCFGPNKIVEIIPQDQIESNNENSNYIFKTENNKIISKNFIYCYSSTINNPDTTIKDSKAIITYWVEFDSTKEYIHKCVLFYTNSKKFSQIYSLYSSPSFIISNKYPTYCTTFREKDILCSYYDPDLNNQFVIETDKIITNNKNNPSIFFVLSDFGQIKGNNMKPISLNKEMKSIFGGAYDVFLAEFHNNNINEKNSTVLLYSLYRKSLHASIVPMFANLDLFFGTNVRDAYVEINLFNYLISPNEMILFFIYKNYLKAVRLDYTIEGNLFKNFSQIENLGYFSVKIENCLIPKYMQTTYFTNLIKYNSNEQKIVDNNQFHYKFQQDIAVLLSCSNSNDDINYNPFVIEMPQCLNDLDSIHGNSIHKINFFLSINAVIYDIYSDPRLKSFRNVGIMFYPIEQNYLGLLFYQIKLKSMSDFIVPKSNEIYEDITHIRFERIIPRFVPTFGKPFYLKYRLFNLKKSDPEKINKLSSNICFFQIKFFPFDFLTPIEGHMTPSTTSVIVSDTIADKIDETCNIPYCALCIKNINDDEYKCQKCDTNQLEVIIKDSDIERYTYDQCICDTNKGFYKEINNNMCICQEFYAYYKSTNLCLPEKKLENGPYYIEDMDDNTNIPIYNDCYYTCKKCSKKGNEKINNCEECKEGFAYIDDDKSNCIDINELKEGYHQVSPDHFIKCHENCISCADKPIIDEEKKEITQFCTECKNYVPFFLRQNLGDEYFNCFEQICDQNNPSLMFAYSENSYECVKNCENGVQFYNNSKICLLQCNNDFPFLELTTKKCYSSCELNTNNLNKISDINNGICTNNCQNGILLSENICSICENKNMFKNKEGNCVKIPEECLVVDTNSGLCKICKDKYYPLKEDLNKESFNCYKSLEEIIKSKNETNYYLNETEGYWDECYESCETCYAYGSENRQRCTKCKNGYHFPYYFDENKYNNCYKNLTPNENCTSTQVDMNKYKDFCHLCKEGYSFVYGTEKCRLNEELNQTGYYEKEIIIKDGENRTKEIKVKIYYPCYKYCKTCKGAGDYYDHKCISCIDGYIFENERKKKCIFNTNYSNVIPTTEIPITSKPTFIDNSNDEIIDSEENIWFKLGDNSFYYYQQKYCLIIFYQKIIFLINNKIDCINICRNWNRNECQLKNYTRFKNMSREEYDRLIENSYVYDEIRDNVNIIYNQPDKKLYFHLTNYVTKPPKNLSYIDISEFQDKIIQKYNKNLLLMKVDIKREDTQSTQVEYQFYNPDSITEKVNLLQFLSKRRLDNNNNGEIKLKIDLPVNWTEDQIEKITYLDSQNIDAFNSSSDFYIDNCNQFTSSKGNDVFLKERKKTYYPDIPLCEKDCSFVKFNSDTQRVTCECNYKTNSDNYKDVTFVNNPVDKKFLKNFFLENIQTMKCIKVIFKWENLKSNAGFIIMILFIIIFILSLILYILSAGFKSIHNFSIESLKDENVIKIIERKEKFKPEIENEGPEALNPEIIKVNGGIRNLLDQPKENENNKNPENDVNKGKTSINEEIKNIIVEVEDDGTITNSQVNISNHLGDNQNIENNNNQKNLIGNNSINSQEYKNVSSGKDLISNGTNENNSNNNGQIINSNLKKEDSDNNRYNISSGNNPLNNSSNIKEQNKDNEGNSLTNENKEKTNNENIFDDEEHFSMNNEINKAIFINDTNNKSKHNDNNQFNNNNESTPNNNTNNFSNNSNNNLEHTKKNLNGSNNNNLNDNFNDNDISKLGNIHINDILETSNFDENNPINDPQKKINKNKKENQEKEEIKTNNNQNSQDTESMRSMDFQEIMKKKKIDIYAIDHQIDDQSQNSNPNLCDLISNNSSNSNPPKKGKKKENENEEKMDEILNINKKKLFSLDIEPNQPSSTRDFNKGNKKEHLKENDKGKNYFKRKFEKMNKVDISVALNFNDDLLTLEEFGNKYKTFQSIYIADLKKHHLIYFTFFACNDNNNLFLKLSFFCLSVNFYFGLNTILIFNSNMSDAYYDKSKSKAGYILMNLLLPFVICGLISFIIKIFIMPQYYISKMIRKIQNNKIINNSIDVKMEQPKKEEKIKTKNGKEKHSIKNEPKNINLEKIHTEEYIKEIKNLENEFTLIYCSYLKRVTIYYVCAIIILILNWYMMTSFCAIFLNTGVKLISNSFISLLSSFILPFIFALIPTLLGFLSKKKNNNCIYKVYKTINILL